MLEWKKLGDLCVIKTGKLNANAQVENGQYPFFTCDINPYRINTYAFDGEAILIAGNGNVGHLNYYVGKFNAYQRTYVLMDFKIESTRYLLHYLSNGFKAYMESRLKKGSVPYITLPLLSSFPIPVPSIPEQFRIVDILDTFTASIENIKQQIEQRRKQYEYYRSQLLSGDRWEKIMIGKLTKVFSCPRVFKDQWRNSGVPFWRSSDIMSYHNGVKNPRGEVFISQTLYEELSCKSEKIKGGDILVTGGGSIGMPYLKSDDSPLFVKDADLICIQKCSSIVPKYLYHYFLSTDFKLYLKKITHDATIAHYTINQIKDTPIPVPSLAEQSRIVGILDTFEASIANLEQQLEMREKQYEYYRNKLLTF